MPRILPYLPAILIAVGAVFSLVGAFWSSIQQSADSAALSKKNEEIAHLQLESANLITGGDSFCWLAFQVFAADGGAVNAFSMPDDLLLIPMFIHKGKYPLYDVLARIVDIDAARKDIQSGMNSYIIGNMTPGLATSTKIRLPHHGKDFTFNIFYAARNGTWIQFLRMRWVGDGWGLANKVVRGSEVIYRDVSANFPRGKNGEIDWGEPGAQDLPTKQ